LRPVAIKVFVDDPKESRSFRSTVENFQRDSRFLAGLASGNPIVEYHLDRICDLFVDERRIPRTLRSRSEADLGKGWALTAFLVVMEYADGGCLGQTYRTEVVLHGDKFWVDHFPDTCTALRAAHGRNIVHRDIKPHNIMWFREQNRVKIGDFGTAKDFSEEGFAESYLLGSLPYMSPESFRGQAPPGRDIFALGCTFFELLTGKKPFANIDPSSLVASSTPNFEQYVKTRHEAERPDAFVIAPQIVSIDLSRLLKKMMSATVDDRPDFDEIIDVLRREKPRRIFSEESTGTVELPKSPKYLSRYEIHPQFRIKVLKECPFLVFIRTNVRSEFRLKMLFGLLKTWFGDSFSAYEVFGRCDFMIRIWAGPSDSKITDFCSKVIDQVLDGQKSSLKLMMCENAFYLGASKDSLNHDVEQNETLVLLNEAQKHASKEAEAKLKRGGVYCRPTDSSAKGGKVKCFTLITNETGTSESERETKLLLIRHAIEQEFHDLRRWNISLFLKAYQGIRGFEAESSDYVVSFTAPSYNDIVKVPSAILEKLRDHRIQTDSLLATKRYFVESDKILLR
jgi:serine/threonine protein kinase